jgi:kynureninase
MNSLTANLHFMMSAFYCPTPTKFKILTEKKAFPSDTHAAMSQILLHGYDPKSALLEVGPREGETTLRMEDILEVYFLNLSFSIFYLY